MTLHSINVVHSLVTDHSPTQVLLTGLSTPLSSDGGEFGSCTRTLGKLNQN